MTTGGKQKNLAVVERHGIVEKPEPRYDLAVVGRHGIVKKLFPEPMYADYVTVIEQQLYDSTTLVIGAVMMGNPISSHDEQRKEDITQTFGTFISFDLNNPRPFNINFNKITDENTRFIKDVSRLKTYDKVFIDSMVLYSITDPKDLWNKLIAPLINRTTCTFFIGDGNLNEINERRLNEVCKNPTIFCGVDLWHCTLKRACHERVTKYREGRNVNGLESDRISWNLAIWSYVVMLDTISPKEEFKYTITVTKGDESRPYTPSLLLTVDPTDTFWHVPIEKTTK